MNLVRSALGVGVPLVLVVASMASGDFEARLGTTDNAPEDPSPSSGLARSYHDFAVGGVEAKGVGLRSLGSGPITLTDVPAGATVKKAFLYWMIQHDVENADFKDVTLDGQAVTGELIGQGAGLCWGTQFTFAYRADVTALVNGPGVYEVADVKSGRTDGADISFPRPLAEGASLVVIWEQIPGGRLVEVTIVDGFDALTTGGLATTYRIPATTLPAFPILGSARLHVLGGDGQRFADETMNVNGILVAANAWDGNVPQRIPDYSIGNLWDTDAFNATPFHATNQRMDVTLTVLSDCIGPEALVLVNGL